jgi:hypothetical protein
VAFGVVVVRVVRLVTSSSLSWQMHAVNHLLPPSSSSPPPQPPHQHYTIPPYHDHTYLPRPPTAVLHHPVGMSLYSKDFPKGSAIADFWQDYIDGALNTGDMKDYESLHAVCVTPPCPASPVQFHKSTLVT